MPSRRKIAQIRAEMGDFASARQASTQFADPVHHRVCDIDGAGADVGRPLIRRVGDAKEGDRDLDHAIAPYADGTGLRTDASMECVPRRSETVAATTESATRTSVMER